MQKTISICDRCNREVKELRFIRSETDFIGRRTTLSKDLCIECWQCLEIFLEGKTDDN